MTEYSRKEFQRLLDAVQKTDPSTMAYHTLMQSIEMFNAIALPVDDFLTSDGAPQQEQVIGVNNTNVAPFDATDFPADTKDEAPEGCLHVVVPRTDEPAPVEEKKEEDDPPLTGEGGPAHAPKEEKTYDSPTVRKALLDARARGVNVKELLRGFGADGFQGVPAEKYGALMDALRAV